MITYDKAAIVQHMKTWFLSRYEDPAESCPYDEGAYVYIWGGPVSAQEALDEGFGHLFAEDLIAATAKQLEDENEIFDWANVPEDEEPGEIDTYEGDDDSPEVGT